MEAFVVFRFLHILAMIFAIALLEGGGLLVRRVAQTRDARTILTALDRMKSIEKVANMLLLAGIVFGLLAALTGNFDLLRPWLIGSYVALVVALVVAGAIVGPWMGRLAAAAVVNGDGSASSELTAVVTDPRARIGSWALTGLLVLIVFLMVVKPLG